MKRILTFILLMLMGAGFQLLAQQESVFDKEVEPWHQKATQTCGMLRDMKTFNADKMIASLNELEKELQKIMEKYSSNPPAEYAKDPLWKTYFEDLMDNIKIVRERVEKKEYRLAQKYCAQFCTIFGKMHRTNGRVKLTDMLFSFRASIRDAMDMVNAGNYEGAKEQLKGISIQHEKIEEKILRSSEQIKSLNTSLMSIYKRWYTAVSRDNIEDAKDAFNTFMNEFPKLYQATFQN